MTSGFPNLIRCLFRTEDDGPWQAGYFAAWSNDGEKCGDYAYGWPVAIVGSRLPDDPRYIEFRAIPLKNLRMEKSA